MTHRQCIGAAAPAMVANWADGTPPRPWQRAVRVCCSLMLLLCTAGSLHAASPPPMNRGTLQSATADPGTHPLPDPKQEAAERQRRIAALRQQRQAEFLAHRQADAAHLAISAQVLDTLASGADASALVMQAQSQPAAPATQPAAPKPARFAALAKVVQEFDNAVASVLKSTTPASAATAQTLLFGAKRIEAEQMLVLDRLAHWAELKGEAGKPWLHFGGDTLQRLGQYQQLLGSRFARRSAALRALQSPLSAAANGEKAAAQALSTALQRWTFTPTDDAAPPAILGLDLPVSRPRFAPLPLPASAPITPSFANSASEIVPDPADLASQPGAELDGEILAKAADLGYEYTRIYDFVRGQVATDWYAGAMRGANGSLRALRGNDVDQALLLAALLRASGAPTRLIQGTLEVPVALLSAQLAVPESKIGAALVAAGIANEAVVRGGRVAAYRIAHTWVSTFVPITDYRGNSVSDTGRTWLPLAPALKPYRYSAGQDVLARAGVTADGFMDTWLHAVSGTRAPWEVLREQLTQALAAQNPPISLESQQRQHALDATDLKLLPLSLPAEAARVHRESPLLADGDVQSVRIRVLSSEAPDATVALEYRAPVYQWLGRRLTLSYAPASEDDTNLANAYGGLGQTPPFLVRVRPRLSLEGVPLRFGERELLPGTRQVLEIEFTSPAGTRTHRQTLLAGGYAAVVIAGPDEPLRITDPQSPASGDGEYQAARLLYNLGARYLNDWNQSDRELAATLGTALIRPLPSLVLVLNQNQPTLLDGLVTDLVWKGVAIDAGLRPVEPIAADAERERNFLRLSALQGSALERLVFERQWAVDAVSAEKGLALARAAGIEILELAPGADLNALGYSASIRGVLQTHLDAGYHITIPRSPLTRDAWTGIAWVSHDPASGASGWFITGNYAGAATTPPPELWFLEGLRELLQDPYAAPVNADSRDVRFLVMEQASLTQTVQVGTVAPKPLTIIAVDITGRPVRYVDVRFHVRVGEARLIGAGGPVDTLNVVTDEHGVAQAHVQMPEQIGDLLTYELLPVQVAQDLGVSWIEVSASGALGPVEPGLDFQVLARPGPADHVEYRVAPEVPTFITNVFWAEPIPLVQVYEALYPAISELLLIGNPVDTFGNPVRGVAIMYSVQWGRDCYHPPPTELEPDPAPPACPCFLPEAPKACDASLVPLTEDNVTLGSPCAHQRPVVISRPPVGAMAFVIAANGGEGFGNGGFVIVTRTQHFRSTAFAFDAESLSFSADCPIENESFGVALMGRSSAELLPVGGRTRNSWGIWRFGRAARSSPCGRWPEVCPLIANTDWNPALWQFDFSNGSVVNRRTETGALPGLPATSVFRFDLQASNQPYPILGTAKYIERDNILWEIQLRADVAQLLAPGVTPEVVPLLSGSRTGSPITIEHHIVPDYVNGLPLQFELTADGEVVKRGEMLSGAGGSKYSIGRGFEIDPLKRYEARTVVRDGSPYRMESPPTVLQFRSDLINGFGLIKPAEPISLVLDTFPRAMVVRHDVDVGRQTACVEGARFAYKLQRESRLSFKIYATDRNGVSTSEILWRPLDEEVKAEGDYYFDISPNDLPFGNFNFVFTATATNGPEREQYEGTIKHIGNISDTLPVGHTMVKGVDIHAGNAVLSEADIAIGGRGPGLRLTRTYNSHQGNELSFFGRGWSSDLDSRVVVGDCGQITVIGAQGNGQGFGNPHVRPDGVQEWTPERGYHGSLIYQDGAYDFYAKDGTRYHYAQLAPDGQRLSYIEDTNGNRVSYTYEPSINEPWRVARIEDSAQRQIVIAYETRTVSAVEQNLLLTATRDFVKRVEGPGGLRIDYTYDAAGNLSTVTRGSGQALSKFTYGYTDLGGELYTSPGDLAQIWQHFGYRLTTVTNSVTGAQRLYDYEPGLASVGGSLSRPRYLPMRVVKTVTEPDGGKTDFEYIDVRGVGPVSTVVTDARRKVSTYRMDRYGLVTQLTDPAGIERTDWDLDHLSPAVSTDRVGTVTRRSYDANGNQVVERIEHPTAGVIERRWTYLTPEHFAERPYIKNRLGFEFDGEGHRSNYAYDPRGNRLSRSKGGINESWTYLANGDLATYTDGARARWLYLYDVYGYQRLATAPDAGTVEFTYDVRGRLLTQTDELGRKTDFSYDELDRLLSTRLPVVSGESARPEIRVAYADAERRRLDIDVLGRTTRSETDIMGRVTKLVRPSIDGELPEIQREYDRNGNLTSETDELGRVTLFEYDASNRLVLRTQPLDRRTAYVYDAEGHVLEQTTSRGADAEKRVVRYEYKHPLYKLTKTERLLTSATGQPEWLSVDQEFDHNGNLKAVIDGRGHRTSLEYDQRDRLILRTEPLGRVIAFEYDGADRKVLERRANAVGSGEQLRHWRYDGLGRLLSETDAHGGVQSYEYDVRGNRVSQLDALNHPTTLTYDARDRLVEQRNIRTNQVRTFGYDVKGNRTSEQWPGGRQLSFIYDRWDRLTDTSDQLGVVAHIEYDHKNNVLQRQDGLGRLREWSYDDLDRATLETLTGAEGLLLSETRDYNIHGELIARKDGRDHTTRWEYDSAGRKTAEIAPAPLSYQQNYEYDRDDHLIRYIDARGYLHDFTIDALGRKTAEADPTVSGPGGGSYNQSWAYDTQDNLLQHDDRLGIADTYRYDLNNRLLTHSRDGELKLTQTFDLQGNLLTQSDANGQITQFEYDEANRRTLTLRPEGIREALTYTADDDIATRTDALTRVWRNDYDVRKRLISERNPEGELTVHDYDNADNRVQTTRPLLQPWVYAYDGANRLRSVTSPLTWQTTYRYDLAGNRIEDKNARGHTVTQTFDVLNRRSTRALDTTSVQRWTYDGANNLTREETPNGAQIDSNYDELNRRVSRLLQGAAAPGAWSGSRFTFDANGKLLTETTEVSGQPAWTRTRQYDRQERVVFERDGDGATLATTYDPQNNRLSLTDSAGDQTLYTYDHANRLTSVAAPAIGTTEYRYNTASQLIERTGQGGFISVSSYDLAGRVKTIQHRVGGSPTLTLEYDYDRNGNRVEQRLTHAGSGLERTVYRYDDADRLTRSTRTPPAGNALETTWTLDEVGNRTLEEVRELGSLTQRTAYTYDLRDRLQTATPELPTGPPTVYQYDADGNVSSEQIGSAAPTQYRWDARDRLAEYTPAGAPAIRNRYDESDRRIAREDAATGSRYRWDGNALLEETNALGNRLTRYHRGIGLIGATSARTQPDPRQYASDAQDTPLALIRPDGGIAGRATFDIWGKAAWQSGEQSKLGFTGYQKETGDLYQAVARYYRPGTGSFLSTDPWEGDYHNPASLNKYLYGYGNPGIFVDRDGRTAELVALQDEFSQFRDRGLIGFSAAKSGVVEAAWYQKPGMLLLGGLDVGQVLIGAGLEGFTATSNLTANTLIVGAGEMGGKESEIFSPAYDQAAGELYGDLNETFQAVEAIRADPAAAAKAAVSAPISTLEKAIFENDSASQIASGQQLLSIRGLFRNVMTAVRPKSGVPVFRIAEGGDGSVAAISSDLPAAKCELCPSYRGGPHRQMAGPSMRGDGLDSHHMPDRHADRSVSDADGPAIQMDPADHRQTSSNGQRGTSSIIYRAQTAKMIAEGRYRSAMAREIFDVRRAAALVSGIRSKYNDAIKEMLAYARKSGQLPEKKRK